MPRQRVHRMASEELHFRYFQISVNSTGSHKNPGRIEQSRLPPSPCSVNPGSPVAADRSRAGKPELPSFVSIRVHSWFQITPFIRAHSWFIPPVPAFAIIRANPCTSVAKEPRPSVASNLLLKFHQQISGWKARATFIRVHSRSFVVPTPTFIRVHSCSFVVPNHPCIRVQSLVSGGEPQAARGQS